MDQVVYMNVCCKDIEVFFKKIVNMIRSASPVPCITGTMLKL